MIRMNPYAAFLGTRDPLEVVSQTGHELTALMARLGPEGLKRSLAPGKWSAAAIICHLADCEIAFAFRLRQTLAEPAYVIQPFDQEAWARPYSRLQAALALETFGALRRWNLALLEGVAPEDFNRKVTHPERCGMTFRTLVETMAGHDLNHLRQLETIAGAAA